MIDVLAEPEVKVDGLEVKPISEDLWEVKVIFKNGDSKIRAVGKHPEGGIALSMLLEEVGVQENYG